MVGLLFSRNAKKALQTKVNHKFLFFVSKQTTHKASKVAAAKKTLSTSVHVIDQNPWMNECFLFHLATECHCFFVTILPKKRLHETTIFKKINACTENEGKNSKHHTIDQLNKIHIAKLSKKLSLMHLNISSLPYHFHEISELLNDLTIKFKILGITERRLRSGKSLLSDINLPNYKIEHIPIKADKGSALLYIFNELNYKVRNNLQIHKIKSLSQFLLK